MEPKELKASYQDYICRNDIEHHTYIYRYDYHANQIDQIKLRFTEKNGNKIYFKAYVNQNRSEIWFRANDENYYQNRIDIDCVLKLDFSDLVKLKQKLKSYIIFS
jgi:hypothetical protein